MENKIMRKWFLLPDFLEEQDFLQAQHKLGWKFKGLKGINKYIFEKVKVEEFIYQLDVIPPKTNEEIYLQMFKDYGWEYVTKYNTWYYFRKPKNNFDEDLSIFSDVDSKLDMIKRSYNIQIMICLFILPYFVVLLSMNNHTFMNIPILISFISIVLLSIRNIIKFEKLKKIIKNSMDDNK